MHSAEPGGRRGLFPLGTCTVRRPRGTGGAGTLVLLAEYPGARGTDHRRPRCDRPGAGGRVSVLAVAQRALLVPRAGCRPGARLSGTHQDDLDRSVSALAGAVAVLARFAAAGWRGTHQLAVPGPATGGDLVSGRLRVEPGLRLRRFHDAAWRLPVRQPCPGRRCRTT